MYRTLPITLISLISLQIYTAEHGNKAIEFPPDATHIRWTIYNGDVKLFDHFEKRSEFSEVTYTDALNSYKKTYPNARCVYLFRHYEKEQEEKKNFFSAVTKFFKS